MDNLLIYIYNSAPIFFIAIGLYLYTKYDVTTRISNKRLYAVIFLVLSLTVIAILNQYYDDYHNVLIDIETKYGSIAEYKAITGNTVEDYSFFRFFLTSLKHIIRPIVIVYFWLLIMEKDKTTHITLLYIPLGINTLFYLTNYWHHLGFNFLDDLTYVKGKLSLFSFYISFFYVVLIFITSIKRYYRKRYRELVFLIFLFFIFVGARLMEDKFYPNGGQPIINITIMICVMFYFLFLYSKSKEEYIEQKENELKMSQIKPHFIFNALSSIIDLCDEDSEEQKALVSFSKYLRFNIDTLSQTTLVSFETELKQVNTYIELEKYSYGDRINVEYDIQVKNFLLPVLSIQPIVENSIKYGLKNQKKINLKIHTWEDEINNYIEIIDDGPGFDVNNINQDESRKHIGIANVIYRLEEMTNATLIYDSEIGSGTQALVTIPKRRSK